MDNHGREGGGGGRAAEILAPQMLQFPMCLCAGGQGEAQFSWRCRLEHRLMVPTRGFARFASYGGHIETCDFLLRQSGSAANICRYWTCRGF